MNEEEEAEVRMTRRCFANWVIIIIPLATHPVGRLWRVGGSGSVFVMQTDPKGRFQGTVIVIYGKLEIP